MRAWAVDFAESAGKPGQWRHQSSVPALLAGTSRPAELQAPALARLCPCLSLLNTLPLRSHSQVQPQLSALPVGCATAQSAGRNLKLALSPNAWGASSRSRVSRALRWLAERLQLGPLWAAVRRTGAETMFRAVAPGQLRRAVSPGGEGRARWRSGLNLLFLWRSGRRSLPSPDPAGPRAGRPRLNWDSGSKFWGLPLPPS